MNPQKRTVFRSSVIPFPPMRLDPGSCQAVRIEKLLSKPAQRVKVTPEWIAENEAKQKAYEENRAARRKELGVIDSK
jgi:hypothetical protein